ncbi:SprT family zinc-dependent metalloprotease [uncultured Tateyamaria sp.]|uniref:M48 family metallopeptidase n=1 Tax=uncultured Tateyamaria sp. TaxID=455651 RepID=UPI00260DE643|nr:SprT family zinc-dependent metalloprotease [uncultured Tateyamaria sp.]
MDERVLQGDPDIALTLRRSARARRITLRISQLDGRVTLTLPHRVSERDALAFAAEKRDWIARHLASRPQENIVGLGSTLPLEGQVCTLVQGAGRGIRLEGARLIVPGRADTAARRTLGFLKARARDQLALQSDVYSDRLGVGYSSITIRDTRSRWGSCSSEGRLMYSWRLILAPPEVLNYVAAHEVAHLAQMNHSPAFWAEVERIHGPYKAVRRWLKTEGNALHQYRFGD